MTTTQERTLRETQLTLYFFIGAQPLSEDDDSAWKIHNQAYERIQTALNASGASLIPGWIERDPSVSADFAFCPYGLCDDDGMAAGTPPAYSVAFHRDGEEEFPHDVACALRDFCLRHYQEAAGGVPVHLGRASRYQRWEVEETQPWDGLG